MTAPLMKRHCCPSVRALMGHTSRHMSFVVLVGTGPVTTLLLTLFCCLLLVVDLHWISFAVCCCTCGGVEWLFSFPFDPGTLNSLCPSFLDTNQCHRRTTKNNSTTSRQSTCSCMHLTGVYPTLSGVTSAGDMYVKAVLLLMVVDDACWSCS